MNGWLLDTNVISELRRPKPDAAVAQFVSRLPVHLLYVSVVTFAEIRFGIEILKDASKRMVLMEWMVNKARPMFEGRVLEITEDILLKWRLLIEKGRKSGHTFSQADLMIAATAAHHGLTVVSRDTTEFEHANVPVVNPWKSLQ